MRIEGSALFAGDHQDEGRENYTFDRTYDQGGVVASRQFGQDLVKFWYYERDVFIVNVADLFPTKPGSLRYVQYVPTHEQGWSTALNAPLSSTSRSTFCSTSGTLAGTATSAARQGCCRQTAPARNWSRPSDCKRRSS